MSQSVCQARDELHHSVFGYADWCLLLLRSESRLLVWQQRHSMARGDHTAGLQVECPGSDENRLWQHVLHQHQWPLTSSQHRTSEKHRWGWDQFSWILLRRATRWHYCRWLSCRQLCWTSFAGRCVLCRCFGHRRASIYATGFSRMLFRWHVMGWCDGVP